MVNSTLEPLGEVVRSAITYLDRVIDINFYPSPRPSGQMSAGDRSVSA